MPAVDPELSFASVGFRVSIWPAVTKFSGRKLQLPLDRLKRGSVRKGSGSGSVFRLTRSDNVAWG